MSMRTGFALGGCAMMMAISSVQAQQACESLKSLKLDHATVVTAASMEAAPLKQPPGMPFKVPDETVPLHCEVTGVARPTSDSEIAITVWLPPKEAWNGK